MTVNESKYGSFYLKDCTLLAMATGKRAQNLRELRELLRDIDTNSIYYHFWGGLLRPRFDDPEYHNDFALWTANSLHNKLLAERLAVIDPMTFKTLDDLREELIDLIEETLNETEYPTWSKRDDQFEFIRFQLVIFNTKTVVQEPKELLNVLRNMSVGSIFFHFIDGRRRNADAQDDFQNWLSNFDEKYDELRDRISDIDPYFSSLTQLRRRLVDVFSAYFH
ncbi:MAG: hypothetical protein JW944_06060 [Deltaproteobacteria bacterium]|nr:hypothetical protein [Deltaproteobacteria bacterium]